MSEAPASEAEAAGVRIAFALSPLDPRVGRFTLDRVLSPVPRHFPDAAAAAGSPLAAALFATPGVAAVQVADGVITVTRRDDAEWSGLKRRIAAAIRAALAHPAPLGEAAEAAIGRRSDAAVRAAVQEVLDRSANPAIAAHGGRVDVVEVRDGTLSLRMSGGCQGCAASAATLRDGVERMIRAAVPEVVRIIDVTDHAAGRNPYYARSSPPAASPFARPVPAGVISVAEGRHLVDADYLAPRLGLGVERLKAEMQAGRVLAREEHGTDADAGRVRLTLRHGVRAWSAIILPDGRAFEAPPPAAEAEAGGDADLTARVRAHLEARPADAPPITYGELARALKLGPPHQIGQVARALERTMEEDAAAGRPFLAALVVGRARGGLPARGFFETATRLGRGPAPGESEAAFHARALAALRQHQDRHAPGEPRPRRPWRQRLRALIGG